VGDLVYLGSTPVSGGNIYQCLKVNTNISPTATYTDGDGVNWVARVVRTYNTVNTPISTDKMQAEVLVFFKLPDNGDELTLTFVDHFWEDLDPVIISNRSSLEYAVIKPLNHLSTTVSGYGMAIYNSSSELVYLSSEKICNINNMASDIAADATLTSSNANVNWACPTVPMVLRYPTTSTSTRFSQTIKRVNSTTWQNKIHTFSASSLNTISSDTYAAKRQGTFLIGRMD
jgi:hypothetical protein